MSSYLKQRRRGETLDGSITIDDDQSAEDVILSQKYRAQPQKAARLLLKVVIILLLGYTLERSYYELELRITDSSLEGMLYMPISYFQVKYMQTAASRTKVFKMTYNNTFVLHLHTDVDRLTFFKLNNSDLDFQLYSATRLVGNQQNQLNSLRNKPIRSNASSEVQYWIETYPLVRYRLSIDKHGDAAVAISHFRLLNSLVKSDELEYMFVFEDDARLSHDFMRNKEVLAPADVDVVFLMKSALKTVPLRSTGPNEPKAVRVISAWGTYGYVITKSAAKRALQQLVYNQRDPIDVAIMKLAVHSLRIYLPLHGWPQVWHGAVASSKRQYNTDNP